MKKKYQILLCEMIHEDGQYVNTPVYEIGSDSSSFPGQAYNIKIKHSIQGTRELTFDVPKYYFDVDTHSQELNPIPEMLVNKCPIEVTIENKTFFMTVNERIDTKDENEQIFSYTCVDSFIEELSKNGYGLSFKEETGVGTIHDLAEKIVEGTDWVYDEDATGDVYETITKLEIVDETQQYKEVTKPVPTHPLEYVPELGQYVYKLDLYQENLVKEVANLKGQKIQMKYTGSSLNPRSEEMTSKTGKRVLAFSDGSYVQYYRYDEKYPYPSNQGITASKKQEVEKLVYVNKKRESLVLLETFIDCKEVQASAGAGSGTSHRYLLEKIPFRNNTVYSLSWSIKRFDDDNGGKWFNKTEFSSLAKVESPMEVKFLNNMMIARSRVAQDLAWQEDSKGFDLDEREDELVNLTKFYRIYIKNDGNYTYIDAPYTKSSEVTSLRPYEFTITGNFDGSTRKTITRLYDFTLSDEDKSVTLVYQDPSFASMFTIPEASTEPYQAKQSIYCYETSQTVTTQTVRNLLYNSSDFVDTVGWILGTEDSGYIDILSISASTDKEPYKKKYYLQLNNTNKTDSLSLINETAADAKFTLEAGKPYIFKYSLKDENAASRIKGIKIYNKHPKINTDNAPQYDSGTKEYLSKDKSAAKEYLYVIKPKVSISTPYIEFIIDSKDKQLIAFESFSLYPAVGKNTSESIAISNAEENNITLLKELTDGKKITEDNLLSIIAPLDVPPEAFTQKFIQFFIRENYDDQTGKQIDPTREDTLKYLSFAEVNNENTKSNYYTLPIAVSDFSISTREDLEGYEKPSVPKEILYYVSSEDRYYQYYEITVTDGAGVTQTNGKWDLAFFGEAVKNKIRTFSEEKSTRFNLIQSLGELFEVWPVFEMNRNTETGKIDKKFYFKKECLRDNHVGFHEGVNLLKISREIQSEEIVTKTYVEDVEQSFAEEGYISIRLAKDNPSGENFLYNFQYYINQKLINGFSKSGIEQIEEDLHFLYSNIKSLNTQIMSFNETLIGLKMAASDLKSTNKSYAVSIAACDERRASLEADAENEKICEEDRKKIKEQLSQYEQRKLDLLEKQIKIETDYTAVKNQIKELNDALNYMLIDKNAFIDDFENKYSQFIKEGVWSDSKYIDNDAYYYDALKVMNTSSMPKVTWNIEVADTAGIEDYEDFRYEVGDKTFVVDNEFFNVENNENENFKFYVIISEIEECLDEPTATKITVQNFTTSFEDIFQRISASVQSLTLNEHIYARAKNFTPEGKIDESVLQESIKDNYDIVINSNNNDWVLDTRGLSMFSSKENSKNKIHISSEGVFVSNSTDLLGNPIWRTGITSKGINADILTAGKINTSKVEITNSGQANFTWSELGITAYELDNNFKASANTFLRLDGYGLYLAENLSSKKDEDGQTPNFGYYKVSETSDLEIPWFKAKENEGNTVESILDYIQKNTNLSITKRGFLMNYNENGGNLRLGYKDSNHGLWIEGNGMDISLVAGKGFSLNYTNEDENQSMFLGYDTSEETSGLWLSNSRTSVSLTPNGYNFNIKSLPISVTNSNKYGGMTLGFLDKTHFGISIQGRPYYEEGKFVSNNHIFRASVPILENVADYLTNPGEVEFFGFKANENGLFHQFSSTCWTDLTKKDFIKVDGVFYLHSPPDNKEFYLSDTDGLTKIPLSTVMGFEGRLGMNIGSLVGENIVTWFKIDTLGNTCISSLYNEYLYIQAYCESKKKYYYYRVHFDDSNPSKTWLYIDTSSAGEELPDHLEPSYFNELFET